METKYAIIGDVHGCLSELLSLLTKIDTHNRQIVFVGDLVDKGPDPDQVIRLAKQLNAMVVLGNHDEKHIRYWKHSLDKTKKNPMRPSEDFLETHQKIKSIQDKHGWCPFSYLSSFPYYQYIPGHNHVVVHGGLERFRRAEHTKSNIICRVRNLDPVTGKMVSLSKVTDQTPFWTEMYSGEETVVYGHAVWSEPKIENNTVGIDTGCVYGQKLSAYLLPEKEIVSVPAVKKYAELWT